MMPKPSANHRPLSRHDDTWPARDHAARHQQTTSSRQIAEKRGRSAEWRVRWYLWFKGYRLVARRWRCAAGEIDLILRRRNLLVFAEVKYRQHGITDDVLTRDQQQRITRAASLFLAKTPAFSTFDCRFDFIIVRTGQNLGFGKITHIQNAW